MIMGTYVWQVCSRRKSQQQSSPLPVLRLPPHAVQRPIVSVVSQKIGGLFTIITISLKAKQKQGKSRTVVEGGRTRVSWVGRDEPLR